MNYLKKYKAGLALALITVMLISCQKSFDEKITLQSDFSNKSIVQVYMATVNASRNYLYVDANQITGAAMTTGSVFPTTGIGFSADPGTRAFLVRDTLRTTTQVPLSFAENLQVNRKYTLFMYDTITTPKQKTVEDNIVIPADSTARLRFANFIYNPTALAAVDIFSVKRNANVFTNVQITDVTPFIPYASGVVDTFLIRHTGTTINLQNYTPPVAPATVGTWTDIRAILTPSAKRSYTLVFRGGYRAYITTNSTLRTLSTIVSW